MKITFLILSILILISIASATLSPNSARDDKKKNKKNKDDAKNEKKKPEVSEKDVFQRQLVRRDVTAKDILREADILSKHTNIRHYVPGEVLGYITPWNGAGYDRAKKFHKKFDLVSPVWFVIQGGHPFKIPVHDMDKKWLKSMQDANTKKHSVKILPRILFDRWTSDHVEEIFHDLQKRHRFIDMLISLAETNSFDGYVLEIWNQFLMAGVRKSILTALITSIADGLRENDLDTILAIPAQRKMENELFTKEDFEELSPHIRYFSVMTYDFSSVHRPGPNAPVDWIRNCIKALVPKTNDVRRAQILMGLNFYGYHYTPSGGGPIVGSQYLELLEKHKGKLQWDDESEEHFFEVKAKDNPGYVFFPTLYSLMSRLELAVEMKVGIAIWELGQGLNYFMDIL
ncbi:chitinase domain-containing protein 1 [Trichogramma pretiosum]|uniref:chitinase domain-containing protein 1 n=1 Tax=Trichogramma pretiosum TaxID=7493 RepID=UPI0006C94E60|nr:chitinase domain-containing protein 1 [Trichogramma pretiosum]